VEHRAIYAQFLNDFAGEEFLQKPELAAVARLLERAAQGLRFTGKTQQAAARLMPELLAANGLARLLKLLEILDLLAHSKHAVPLSSKTFAPSLKRRDERRIDDVCRFIHDNIAQPIEQPEAARRAHLSVSAFSRFFKKSLGRTFSEYVNELRVGQACRLLIESDKSVAEIAFGSGFENLSNFNRRFRALKGISPRQYRGKYEGRSVKGDAQG
jgi:AraC-like DNA-binding protein